MSLETLIAIREPSQWRTRQVVIFDWYDGPREGVAWLDSPPCEFYFTLLSERPNPDGLDDRLFRISELPIGSVANVLAAIHSLGEPASRTWVPIWKFASVQEQEAADRVINDLAASKTDTNIVLLTRDMIEFQGCWVTNQDAIRQPELFQNTENRVI